MCSYPELEERPPAQSVVPWARILVESINLPEELDEAEQALLDATSHSDISGIRKVSDRDIFAMRPEVWKTALKRALSEEARQTIWDNFSYIK